MPGSEFRFELRVCRWAERNWPPPDPGSCQVEDGGTSDGAGGAGGSGTDSGPPVVVGRQLGTQYRRWDTVVVECDPEGLRERARFGADALDSDLLHVVRDAPAEWTWYREALPEPDYPWRYVREAVHRAADRRVLETRRDGNRIEIRRRWPYPDWVRRVVAVENKPDLDASAARSLRPQLEHDVAMGLADEAWVATESVGGVEPVLLENLPVEAGILAVDPAEGDPEVSVEWYPGSLAVGDPGTRILDRPAGGDHDRSAARFEYVDPAEKAEKRLAIAERAYGRGWRSYADSMRPDCRHFRLRPEGTALLPWCAAKARGQTAAECSGSCPEFEPEPPAWRSRGPPIQGGPGRLQRRILRRRRRRRRPGLSEE
ncbi:hypothetical protein BRD00_12860 [Halobacteriales archaeon QS_8_69_26]|nr:MAG: hypothetical protein BRD00_12860 [Halobacteriales archaeon QS_8_69_26]